MVTLTQNTSETGQFRMLITKVMTKDEILS